MKLKLISARFAKAYAGNGASSWSEAPKHDWSQQELAEFYRVQDILLKAGIPIEFERGLSDEGEPWCVFFRPSSGDVIIHFARYGFEYVVAGGAFGRVLKGRSFREIVDRFLASQPVLLPGQEERQTVFLHPSALLTALVATAFFLMDQQATEASVGTTEQDSNKAIHHPPSSTYDHFTDVIRALIEPLRTSDQRDTLIAISTLVAGIASLSYATDQLPSSDALIAWLTNDESSQKLKVNEEQNTELSNDNEVRSAKINRHDSDNSSSQLTSSDELQLSSDFFNQNLAETNIAVDLDALVQNIKSEIILINTNSFYANAAVALLAALPVLNDGSTYLLLANSVEKKLSQEAKRPNTNQYDEKWAEDVSTRKEAARTGIIDLNQTDADHGTQNPHQAQIALNLDVAITQPVKQDLFGSAFLTSYFHLSPSTAASVVKLASISGNFYENVVNARDNNGGDIASVKNISINLNDELIAAAPEKSDKLISNFTVVTHNNSDLIFKNDQSVPTGNFEAKVNRSATMPISSPEIEKQAIEAIALFMNENPHFTVTQMGRNIVLHDSPSQRMSGGNNSELSWDFQDGSRVTIVGIDFALPEV